MLACEIDFRVLLTEYLNVLPISIALHRITLHNHLNPFKSHRKSHNTTSNQRQSLHRLHYMTSHRIVSTTNHLN